MIKHILPVIISSLLLSTGVTGQQNTIIPPEAYQAMEYRNVGPYRGGRVTAVTGIPGETRTFLMGSTGGGVWKTTDGGISWQNLTDGQINCGSIGSVVVAPSDEDIIYVGTGSDAIRGNVSPGRGLYKSVNGGQTWQLSGLEQAGQIGKIHVHPENPDIVYAAALGNPFARNPERGVYKSNNGGKTWRKVLYHSDSVGAIDLAMHPANPDILYAGLWRAERKPWTIIDGAKAGGVYRSTDAGESWERIGNGLPDESGVLGKVGIAISPANPDRIWVLQQASDEHGGGLYRSDNGGESFRKINRQRELRQRQFYYTHLVADPVEEDIVYAMNTRFYKSEDAGMTFSRLSTPHGDNHDLWINPENNQIMIESNDGGANVSFDGGKSWSTQFNQPTAEIYRVTVDNQFPYRIYGAQQDNSTISIPSEAIGGISPVQDWYAVGGGESGNIAVHPDNPNIVYANTQIGILTRINRTTGHRQNIMLYPEMFDGIAPKEAKYRVQWNAPLAISSHNPDVLYFCSQYVHRSTDEGQTWEVISPDLTTNDSRFQEHPGGPLQHENTSVEWYTTVFSFEESPLEEGVLWAGSDDGLIHLSRNNGETWTNVTPENMPVRGTVNTIDVSRKFSGRAVVAVQRYREGDFTPYVFLTNNYGQDWELLTNGKNGIPADHFVRVVREDPERKGLFYAGTEYGMYVSFNNGRNWQPLQQNLPVTPVTDLKVHRNDLVLATQGRAFWIMDNISPLRELTPAVAKAGLHLYTPETAYRTQLKNYRGKQVPEGPERGAVVYFYLDEVPDEPVRIAFYDDKRQLVKSFMLSSTSKDPRLKRGMNRFVWDMTYPKPEVIPGELLYFSYTGGAKAVPGAYEVEVSAGEQVNRKTFTIQADPRWHRINIEDLQAQFALQQQTGKLLENCHDMIKVIRDLHLQIAVLQDSSQASDAFRELSEVISTKLTGLEEELIQNKTESHQDPVNFPLKLDTQISFLYSVIHQQDNRPTASCYERYEDLEQQLKSKQEKLVSLINTNIRQLEKMIAREQLSTRGLSYPKAYSMRR